MKAYHLHQESSRLIGEKMRGTQASAAMVFCSTLALLKWWSVDVVVVKCKVFGD